MEEYFDVNSEGYFNEKLHLWLKSLPSEDVVKVLKSCFSIPLGEVHTSPEIYDWDVSDPKFTSFGRFDQRIDFGVHVCIILELKVGTEAAVGQLQKYLDYIPAAGYRRGFVILLSRNTEAPSKLGYDELAKQYPNLSFLTWKSLEQKLKDLLEQKYLKSQPKSTKDLIDLISFLTDINKRSEKLIDKPRPASFNPIEYLSTLVPTLKPKKPDIVFGWNNRIQFWDEVLQAICTTIGSDTFCAFRFDFYEWIMRWAYSTKHVVFDIYEDKNYEYLYRYFFSTIHPRSRELPQMQYSELYYRMLLVRDNVEFLQTTNHRVFFRKSGRNTYVYAIANSYSGNTIPYYQLFKYGCDL